MHNYIFDAATNGLLLQAEEINPVACKEPRPVYAEEMDLLGFGRVFDYPRDTGLRSSSAPRSTCFVLKLKN